MSYGTCESAGKKAIGLDQDKRKNRGRGGGGGRVKQTNPKAKRGNIPPHHPTKGLRGAHESNPSALCSQTGQICLHTCLFIWRKPLPREKRTNTPEIDLSVPYSSELRPVLHERTLGIGPK